MKIKTFVTHNGQFHADGVTAIALLQLFNKVDTKTVEIIRARDQRIIDDADLALDVGRIYGLKPGQSWEVKEAMNFY